MPITHKIVSENDFISKGIINRYQYVKNHYVVITDDDIEKILHQRIFKDLMDDKKVKDCYIKP